MDLKLRIPLLLVILSCFVIYGSSLYCFTQFCPDVKCNTTSKINCTTVAVGITNSNFRLIGIIPPPNPSNTSQFQCVTYETTNRNKTLVAGCIYSNFMPCNTTGTPPALKTCIRCNHTDNCNTPSVPVPPQGSSLFCSTEFCQNGKCISKSSVNCTAGLVKATNENFQKIKVFPPTFSTSRFQCVRYETTKPEKALVAGCIFDNFNPCDKSIKPPAGVTVKTCIRCNNKNNCNSGSTRMTTTSFAAILASSIFIFARYYF